jgi:hypothetical protein
MVIVIFKTNIIQKTVEKKLFVETSENHFGGKSGISLPERKKLVKIANGKIFYPQLKKLLI